MIELARAGQRTFGENRLQEAIPKMATVSMAVPQPMSWHMIGHLQRNKVRMAVGPFAKIESVDSVRLAEAIGRRATEDGVNVAVLLEVNVAGDPSKFGFSPEELRAQYGRIRRVEGLVVEGLMTIGAVDAPAEVTRATFVDLRQLRDQLDALGVAPGLRHLSMGMSADYEMAIEEGATIVRVGTALFGHHHQ